MAVPLLIHQTAPDNLDRWDPRWRRCQQSWRDACPSPPHRHLFWDDAGLRRSVAEAFPDLLSDYDDFGEHIQRVDFARAALLFLHGGLYADMDVEARGSPFPHLCAGMVSVVASPYTRNERHQNSMMASPPRHPFWRALVDEAVRRQREGFHTTTWQLTGPQLLDNVVDARPNDVEVLQAKIFNPSFSCGFDAECVLTRHFCTAVWTHSMSTASMFLHQGVKQGDVHLVTDALRDADCESTDYGGLTPLHHAALKGDVAMVKMLIHHRVMVDSLDKNDTTPLHFAVQTSSLPVVEALVEVRARLDVRLRDGPLAGLNVVDVARVHCELRPGRASSSVFALLQGASAEPHFSSCPPTVQKELTCLTGLGQESERIRVRQVRVSSKCQAAQTVSCWSSRQVAQWPRRRTCSRLSNGPPRVCEKIRS